MVAKILNKAKWVLLVLAGIFALVFLVKEVIALGAVIVSFGLTMPVDLGNWDYLAISQNFENFQRALGSSFAPRFDMETPAYYIADSFYQLYGNLKMLLPAVIFALGFVVIMTIEKSGKTEEQTDVEQKRSKITKLIQGMLMVVGIVCLAYFVLDVVFILVCEIWELVEELNGYIALNAFENEFFYVVAWLTQSLLPSIVQAVPVLLLGVLTGGSVLFFLKKKKAVSIETQETDNQPEQEVAVSEEKAEEKAE